MSKILKKLYKIVDKYIVLPISRFLYFLKKRTDKSRGMLDKLLNKPRFLVYLSLIFAVIAFVIVDSNVINLISSQAETITVPVKVIYNDEAYVIEGVPDTIDITISGSREHIYLAKQLGEHDVVLDLTDYTASDSPYKVDYKYTKSLDNLNYKLSPSYATVIISTKVSQVVTVNHELLNIDELPPELSVKNITLDETEVVVKGSEATLAKIAIVKALVDFKDEGINEAGTYNITNSKLVAYDSDGKIIENVEIVPGSVTATVTLDSYSQSVPIQINTTGQLISGKAISSIQINGTDTYSVTIYGDKEDIENIKSYPVTINIDGYGKNSVETFTLSLQKQSGVRHISVDSLEISVTFGETSEKTVTIPSRMTSRNLTPGLAANVISSETISVQVKGVASVISPIDAASISSYVDLAGLGVGIHEVDVQINNVNPLVTYLVSSKIRVEITEEN